MNTHKPSPLHPAPPGRLPLLLPYPIAPSPQLLAVIELDAELAELQELDRLQWLRDRVAQPGQSISWPPAR